MTRDASYKMLYNNARIAGLEAGRTAGVTPMLVGSPTTPLGNDIDPNQRTYVVPDGPCGFAWINVRPGNSPFANWAKREGLARKDTYHGGVTFWVRDFGQSMQRKEAYADAFARVLQAASVNASAQSRMD